jgi:hypothetical protein
MEWVKGGIVVEDVSEQRRCFLVHTVASRNLVSSSACVEDLGPSSDGLILAIPELVIHDAVDRSVSPSFKRLSDKRFPGLCQMPRMRKEKDFQQGHDADRASLGCSVIQHKVRYCAGVIGHRETKSAFEEQLEPDIFGPLVKERLWAPTSRPSTSLRPLLSIVDNFGFDSIVVQGRRILTRRP